MTHFNEKFIYAVLFSIALLSWWLLEISGIIETKKAAISQTSPDYFSKGYTKWEMDEVGQPKSKLIAEEMTHEDSYWATRTRKPIIEFYNNDNRPPWIINAETGVLSKDGKKLQLNGKVTINRLPAEGIEPLTINTSNLLVSPDTSYAETKDWADIINPPNITSGNGMKVTFKAPIHIELLSKVKGKYETK